MNLKELKLYLEKIFKKTEKKCKKFKKFTKTLKLLKRKIKKIEYNFFNIGFITNNNSKFTYKSENVSSDKNQNEMLDEDNYMNFIVIGGKFYDSGFFSW